MHIKMPGQHGLSGETFVRQEHNVLHHKQRTLSRFPDFTKTICHKEGSLPKTQIKSFLIIQPHCG